MNKLKRIISLAFIIAFALSQFESIKAESVKADMTDAKNAETVVASEEVVKEEVKQDAQDAQETNVAGCQTHEEAVDELTKAMDEKMSKLNTKTDDYMLRVNKVEKPQDYQNPSEYKPHYQLSFTILNKEKSFSEIDMTNLAELINDLYKEDKIDRIKFTLNKDEGSNLKDKLANLDDEQRKVEINALIKKGLINSMILGEGRKLGTINNREGGVRLSKKSCDDKEAFLWLRIPFRNAIVNEIKDKIEAKDIIAKKGDKVNWKDGVKVKDAYKSEEGYQGHIDNAVVTDESARDTETAGEKIGKIKLKFTDDTELTLDNQKLIVNEDKNKEEDKNKDKNKEKDKDKDKDKAEDNNKEKDKNNKQDNNKDKTNPEKNKGEKEAAPPIKEREKHEIDKNYRRDKNEKANRNERKLKNDKNIKTDTKTDIDKKETKTEEKTETKQDYGVLAPAQALKLVQHTDLAQGEKGDAARELLARGILSGVSPTQFKGKLAINRAMLAQVLMTISKDKSVGLIDYEDIKGDEWYADAMTWALTHGIYKGYPDKTVKATQKITRQEFASVIYSFIKEHNINMPKVKDFNYKDQAGIAPWALDAVKHLDEIGLVSGENMENYNAKGTYTREELALTIYKIIRFIESK